MKKLEDKFHCNVQEFRSFFEEEFQTHNFDKRVSKTKKKENMKVFFSARNVWSFSWFKKHCVLNVMLKDLSFFPTLMPCFTVKHNRARAHIVWWRWTCFVARPTNKTPFLCLFCLLEDIILVHRMMSNFTLLRQHSFSDVCHSLTKKKSSARQILNISSSFLPSFLISAAKLSSPICFSTTNFQIPKHLPGLCLKDFFLLQEILSQFDSRIFFLSLSLQSST